MTDESCDDGPFESGEEYYGAALECSFIETDSSVFLVRNLLRVRDLLVNAIALSPSSPDIYNLMGWVTLQLSNFSDLSDTETVSKDVAQNTMNVFGEDDVSLLDQANFYFTAAGVLYPRDSIDAVHAKTNLGVTYYKSRNSASPIRFF